MIINFIDSTILQFIYFFELNLSSRRLTDEEYTKCAVETHLEEKNYNFIPVLRGCMISVGRNILRFKEVKMKNQICFLLFNSYQTSLALTT